MEKCFIWNCKDKSMDYREIVEALDLSSHPEGGFYKEVYRSDTQVRSKNRTRVAGTGIYFLLPKDVCTNWHRVSSDECWHFYKGKKLVLEIIDEQGNFDQIFLSNVLSDESRFQTVVPKNCWQRAYSTGSYSLVGCTVAPGFEFEDFEMIEPQALADQYSDIEAKILNDPFS